MSVHFKLSSEAIPSIQPPEMNRGGSTGPRRKKITTQYGNVYYMTPENAPKEKEDSNG